MPRRKKIVEYNVNTLIRDYDKFPLRKGEDLQIVKLMQDGAITREAMRQALWDADEADFRREWRRKNSTFVRPRPEPAEGEEDEDADSEDGSDPVA